MRNIKLMNWYKFAKSSEIFPDAWVDTFGNIYPVEKHMHSEWPWEEYNLLKERYDIDVEDITYNDAFDALIENNWIRMTTEGINNVIFVVKSFNERALRVIEKILFDKIPPNKSKPIWILEMPDGGKEKFFYWSNFLESGENLFDFIQGNLG